MQLISGRSGTGIFSGRQTADSGLNPGRKYDIIIRLLAAGRIPDTAGRIRAKQ